MGELFEKYPFNGAKGSAIDEMFASPKKVRPSYGQIFDALNALKVGELRHRTSALADSYLAQGVTFDFAGEEHPFPLDAVPRVIDFAEWEVLEAGIKQRVRVLEAFLADVYGRQQSVADGVIPASLITSPNIQC